MTKENEIEICLKEVNARLADIENRIKAATDKQNAFLRGFVLEELP
jgi:hypothetical protein